MKTHELQKNSKGEIRVKYSCPKCAEKLESELSEAGNPDRCPACGNQFVVPGIRDRLKFAEVRLAEQHAAAKSLQSQLEEATSQIGIKELRLSETQQSLADLEQRVVSRNSEIAKLQQSFTEVKRQLAPNPSGQPANSKVIVEYPRPSTLSQVVIGITYILLGLWVLLCIANYASGMRLAENAIQQSAGAGMVAAEVVLGYALARCVEKLFTLGW